MNDLGNKGYLVFGLILFVWELLPTTLLVGFFRVHRPPQDLVRASVEGWPWAGPRVAVGSQWGLGESSMAAPSPRAPAASSMGRSLAPVPTSSIGLGTVRTRAAPGSTAGARAPGRSLRPTSSPLSSWPASWSPGDLEPGLAPLVSPSCPKDAVGYSVQCSSPGPWNVWATGLCPKPLSLPQLLCLWPRSLPCNRPCFSVCSMSGSLGSGSWYGAIGREPGWYGGSQTRTTPLLFSQVLDPGSHHHSLYSTPQT